jgi:hypothetical protein
VSVSRLSQIARALGVSVSFFLEDAGASGSLDHEEAGMVQCRETLEVIRAYHQIGDAGVRRRVVDLMRSMGLAGATRPNGHAGQGNPGSATNVVLTHLHGRTSMRA